MERLVRHPWIVLALVAAVTAPFAWFATGARIDSSVESLLDPDDPDTRYYREVKELFGSEEVDVVALVTDDVFRPATLEKVKSLSARLARVRGVARVTSLATVETLATTADGAVDLSPVMEEVPRDPGAVARLRKRIASDPLLAGALVSADGKATAILVGYEEMSDTAFARSGIHLEVERVVAEARGPEEIHLAGVPTLKAAAARSLARDTILFRPFSLLVIVAVLFFSFRTLRGVVLPVATTGIGLVWTVGLMAWLDVPIDIATVVLPALLTALGSAYATHVVASYYAELAQGTPAGEVPSRILRHIGLPVLVTALTTVLGFASLIVYRVAAIRHLGLFATFGISALFVLALTFVVAVLALLPVQRAAVGTADDGPLRRLLARIIHFDLAHRAVVLGAGVAVLAVFGWGIRYVRVDTNYLNYFPEGSPVREASRVVSQHFGGMVQFLVVVDGPPDSISRLDTLQRMASLQDFIARLPGVVRTTSLVDYVRVLNRAFHDDDPAYYTLPDSDRAAPQYLLLLGPEALRPVVNADFSRAAISVRAELRGSHALAQNLAAIRQFAAGAFPADFAVHPTGMTTLLNRTADELAAGQLQSVVLALLVVFVTLAVFFLSVRLGLVALIPNVVPIVIFFGLLGWADIPLSISTAVIASIALGMGVDEAIHLLTEFNRDVRRHADQRRAVLAAMESVGPPVVYTTVALTLGFLVPCLSSFTPVRQFGYLSALNVGTSLLADLFFLPALIASVRFVTLWDVLTVRLGRAPHETIPLFHGLRASQARIAALLGELRTVAAGDRILTRGEAADAMYVLIDGRARITRPGGDGVVPLAEIGRGEVVGEMGLVRRTERVADVVALEPTELLVVDRRFLDVLRRRYPRIATVVLLNLTHILSDRVQEAGDRLVALMDGAREQGGLSPRAQLGGGPP